MKMEVDVREIFDLEAAMKRMPEHGVKRAAQRALRRVGDSTQTLVKRATAEQSGMKRTAINAHIKPEVAKLQYDIVARGKHTQLVDYGATQRKKGVSARPWGKRRIFRGTFVARNTAGGTDVFRRTGEFRRMTSGLYSGQIREVIEPLFGPAIPKEMVRGQVPYVFFAEVRDKLTARFEHELTAIEQGFIKRRKR